MGLVTDRRRDIQPDDIGIGEIFPGIVGVNYIFVKTLDALFEEDCYWYFVFEVTELTMDADGERSLPGMSLPKWMRRTTERYDYTEYYCASPPSNPDGFFHMKNRQEKNAGQLANNDPECLHSQKRRELKAERSEPTLSKIIVEMDKTNWINNSNKINSIQLQRHASDNDCSSIGPEPANAIYKTVSTSSLVTKRAEMSLPSSPKMTTKQFDFTRMAGEIDSRESEKALSKVDKKEVIPIIPVPPVIITKPDDGERSLFGVVEKSLVCRSKSVPCSPDVTPNSTPAVTPCSSPQMGRRACGNPFFTGSSSTAASGSWLFRPAQPEPAYTTERDGGSNKNNLLYETKVDVQVNPSTKTVNKSVRYVPRPSELRELNFWSPTSM
ncbi:unnamed protein product [Allacma fusca]|uniref:Uncharacterized protein n=1 Tax=Allacma fusca TaxID=39272 RepID=A0A8J2KRI9_9HEXA|nr:unnamed protein product [Allacma fusca]